MGDLSRHAPLSACLCYSVGEEKRKKKFQIKTERGGDENVLECHLCRNEALVVKN